jgi:anti-sigma factor RsiW
MCTDAYKESLIAFVYGELPRDEQRAFEAHLSSCAACRDEVSGLRAVRDDLLAWAPPECRDLPSSWAVEPHPTVTPMDRMRSWAPAFGLAAAATLVLAAAASIANLEVRYDEQGFAVRTGRVEPAAAQQQVAAFTATPREITPASVTPDDLVELETRLRRSFDEAAARPLVQNVGLSSNNPQLSREVRRLIEEAENRVRQEMAAQLISIDNEWNARRMGDYQRLQQAIGLVERRTGVDLATQRNELNRLMLASQGQGQK